MYFISALQIILRKTSGINKPLVSNRNMLFNILLKLLNLLFLIHEKCCIVTAFCEQKKEIKQNKKNEEKRDEKLRILYYIVFRLLECR